MATNSVPSSLYGIPKPKNDATKKDLTSSSTLAFATHLSSLISKDPLSSPSTSSSRISNTPAIRGRVRPSRSSSSPADSIFTVHNKGAQKRAAADEAGNGINSPLQQVHQRAEDIGGHIDAATLHRSKRRMEEKVRIYEDLKQGWHLQDDSSGGSDSENDNEEAAEGKSRGVRDPTYTARIRRKEKEALVDFDRKWAEEEVAKEEGRTSEGDAGTGTDPDAGPFVEYEDEFGRSRRGTKAEAARAAKLKRQQQQDGEGRDAHASKRARPVRPENLIYGAAVQTQAFNPEASVTTQMSSLAARRDRSPTPPAEVHYDADAEVRNRGTGFYAFSRDERLREKEMAELMDARKETELEREARRERHVERDQVRADRRKQIQELRGKRQAERFLDGLSDYVPRRADAVACKESSS